MARLTGAWAAMAILLCFYAQATSAQGLRTGSITPYRPKKNNAVFVLNITVARGSPSCGPTRYVILVNGMFQPTLYANVKDTITVTINNNIPLSFPQTSKGVSLHWHGFSMWDEAAWADGTAYVTQCPIQAGTSYTYSFLADESPGTYLWHDHNTMNRANGLQGAIVLGYPVLSKPIPVPYTWDGEHIVFISDWFNQEVNMMAMQLNRPADQSKVTNDTGVFTAVGNADALLVNGKGVQQDCFVGSTAPTLAAAANVEKPPDRCNVKQLTMQPGDGSDGGCTHEVFIVEQDKTYNFRIINAATQQYLTVCFENHSVSIMAADVTPVDFVPIDSNCVDINTGQRYDLSITADQPPGIYWISIHEQFSTAAPSTYAILRYVTANSTTGLPTTPTPQPGVIAPWSQDVLNSVGTSDFILGYNDNYDFEQFWNLFMHGATYDVGVLFPDLVPDKLITFNMTQPLMGNGVMKWAVNNVAHLSQPPCSPLMDQMMADPVYVNEHLAPNTTDKQQQMSNVLLSVHTFNRTGDTPVIYKDIDMNGGVPVKPVAGMHVVQFENGSIVDIVINNLPASSMNGDYRPNVSRANSMQHPIHMHGHRFWVLGSGDGIYNDTIHRELLNWRNPILRDTATLPRAGWLYIRFRAGNPGLWPLHCHILWHSYMGQMVFFAEGMDLVKKRPKEQPGPPCPAECLSSFAPFTRSWVAKQYNGSRFDLPKK